MKGPGSEGTDSTQREEQRCVEVHRPVMGQGSLCMGHMALYNRQVSLKKKIIEV